MLRHWQLACIEKAMFQFKRGQRHFFCQATPGAGKTRMSAELSLRMLDANVIDLVICFAPSREVVQGFKSTLELIVGKRFDGKLGSFGTALTYQSMDYLDDNFWSLFQNYRVLAIFDEIHHCAEHESGLSNRWGQLIVQRIQDHASYNLALSGTPWRSDELGIALARYSTPEGKLICDYRYSLASAVADKVCRSPRILLLDNEDVHLTVSIAEDQQTRSFDSVAGLLGDSVVRYQDLLDNPQALRYMLEHAIARLDEVRQSVTDAAGLAVASTIEHAWQVAAVLESLGQQVVLVSSDSPDARAEIQKFRISSERWIVAVGMVAEGTDIPRIQVCCHLTRIRTELHFRQVLGRTLRRRGYADPYAWMYVFAEPTLSEFASRVADDLPEDLAVLNIVAAPSNIAVEVTDEEHRFADTIDVRSEAPQNSDQPESVELLMKQSLTLLLSERFKYQLLTIL